MGKQHVWKSKRTRSWHYDRTI